MQLCIVFIYISDLPFHRATRNKCVHESYLRGESFFLNGVISTTSL